MGDSEDEMVAVTVLVPKEKIGRLYALVSDLLEEGEDDSEGVALVTVWGADDGPLLAELWDGLPSGSKKVIAALLDGDYLTSEELGLDKYELSGKLAWPGRRCKAVGRENLVRSRKLNGKVQFSLAPGARTLLAALLTRP